MDFSETYKHSGPCAWSPDGKLLAIAVDYRLVVRDLDTLQVVQLYSCLDKISHIEWAPDSIYILCGLFKRAMVQVWSIENAEWTCKIDEGPAGIVHARWSPDGRHILTTSDFQLRVTVWSLVNTACVYVQWPKHATRGLSFSHDGRFMAVAVRRDCKDSIHVLSCDTWEIMESFAVDTFDLADLQWAPEDSCIAVWDSLLYYKVLVYAPDGRCLAKYQAYENALGVKGVMWSPSGQFLAIGSYDQAVRILNYLTWKPLMEHVHPQTIRGPSTVVVYKEVEETRDFDASTLSLDADSPEELGEGAVNCRDMIVRARYQVCEVPVNVPCQKPLPDKPNPKQGPGLLAWSADSRFVCTRNDNMPTAMWIWDVSRLELAAVLLQKEPIRAAAWDPLHPRLILCTGNSRLYMWSPEGTSCVHIPLPKFTATNLRWNPNGQSFVLLDKDTFCCAFVPPPSGYEDHHHDHHDS
ncbi:hypothetical protein CBR_g49329 [Chara braunii]|uniref:Anaphase-promoting complex subunit 4 WD40 domain-containing protein n=1 Tax=Chara braunii TaxID=69332 RepID=A0A388M4Y8_CHABU|nr:hypothetical protein CBR_g49329 [Chara braunii]|eukprot:GBG89539.1 hypothetical protein CBR_g49329 [Chara braunii]